MAANEEELLWLIHQLPSMSDAERAAMTESLAPNDRAALESVEAARAATADADLIDVLDSGQAGLDRLREMSAPAELLSVINLAARERPNLFAEALFAAVVLYRGWDAAEAPAITELRERWHWHVHERMRAAREWGDEPGPPSP